LPSVLGISDGPSGAPAGLTYTGGEYATDVVPTEQTSALAFTGGGVGIPLSVGVGLVAAGSALIVWDRRRRA
jgi:hypothetical protein